MQINNKIIVGDCREQLRRFPEASISACITDPPYNYEFIGHKWDAVEVERRIARVQNKNTLVKHIPYGSGLAGGVRNANWYKKVNQNIQDYQEWCYEWAIEVFRVAKPGAVMAAFNSTRTMAHVQLAFERAGFYTRDCIVYRRSSGIPKGLNLRAKLEKNAMPEAEQWEGWHSCLRSEWEAIVVAQKPLKNNYVDTVLEFGTGLFHTANSNGSFQSNIIENIPRDKNERFNVHCTVKPIALMEKLIDLFVPKTKDNLVLDPFAGSGTTLVAAKNLGRAYVGIEIVPAYIDIIERRLTQSETGCSATEKPCVPELSFEDMF